MMRICDAPVSRQGWLYAYGEIGLMSQREFTRKKVQSLTLGEKLRQLREERRLRAIDLSHKICVKVSYITALEEGRYDQLPTKVYVKGFVRSYARYFGVPEDVLLHLFEREYNVFRNINHVDYEEEVSRMPRVPRFVVTPRTVAAFFGALVIAGIGVYLFYGVDNFVSSPWLVVDEPAAGAVIDGDTVTVAGRTRPNSQVRINGQAVLAGTDGSFREDIRLSVGTNTVIVESTNTFDKTTTQQVIVEARYAVAPSVEEVPQKHLTLKADADDVVIAVREGEREILTQTVRAGEAVQASYTQAVTITTSSAKNTLVSTDDEHFTPLGRADVPVRDMPFPPQDASDDDTAPVDKSSQ